MPEDLFDLTGKIALVTGGSRGLGLQMVRAREGRGLLRRTVRPPRMRRPRAKD